MQNAEREARRAEEAALAKREALEAETLAIAREANEIARSQLAAAWRAARYAMYAAMIATIAAIAANKDEIFALRFGLP